MESKNKILIVLFLIALLIASILYACLKDKLLKTNAEVGTKSTVGFVKTELSVKDHGIVKIDSEDNMKLNADVNLLSKGDSCYITADVKNCSGKIVRLTGFEIYKSDSNEKFEDDNVEILAPDIEMNEESKLDMEMTKTFTFTVKMKESSEAENVSSKFDIVLKYENVE